MKHPTRNRRKANAQHKATAERKQRPLPVTEQHKRAAERAAAHVRRYPHPPVYRESYDAPVPVQPFCYGPFLGVR